VYVDAEKADHFRVNYTLRGMPVPAGEHEIVFQFHPRSYFAGTKISMASSILLLLILLGAVYYQWRKKEKEKTLITV